MGPKLLVVILAAFHYNANCQQVDAQCVDHLRTLEISEFRVDLKMPSSHSDAEYQCENNYGVLPPWDTLLNASVKCGSQLIPVDCGENYECLPDSDMRIDDEVKDLFVPVFNATSGEFRIVDKNHTFSCIICQRDVIMFPFDELMIWFDETTISDRFVVRFTSVDIRQTTEVDVVQLRVNMEKLLKPYYYEPLKFNRTLDEAQHLRVDFYVTSNIVASFDNSTTLVQNGTFKMTVEDVCFCPSEETVNEDGGVTLWPRTLSDYYKLINNSKEANILRRYCDFDYDMFHGYWESEPTKWELVFRPCESPDEQYANEEQYKQFLDAADIDARHTNVLHNFATAPAVNNTTLRNVTHTVSREMELKNELNNQIIRDLVTVTANLNMDSHKDIVVIEERANLIVADIDTSDPIVGFAFQGNATKYHANESIMIEKAPAPLERNATAPFAVDVTPILMAAHTRVTFVLLWKHVPDNFSKDRRSQYFEVNVIFPLGQVSAWTFMSYGNYYVTITYFPQQFYGGHLIEKVTALVCIAWNNDLRDWSSHGCEMLYVHPNESSACRCSGKYFVLHDGVPVVKFALKRGYTGNKAGYDSNLMSNFFKDKIILLIATSFECLLSLLGLGSIICTAIRFKHWRENKGHKILLHMVLALTCNLVLGVTASFVNMTTASIGCLVYGVLRHYSFLAMFNWMLVLSCLQLKRLTTVFGAKATTHLILKVSLFAWGLPLLPIIILLGLNPAFYWMDRFERGYCYPERLVFHLTVQGPAGLILLVNLGIFIKILLHICECCGKKKMERHSKGTRAEQLNKLKTSFFIFFLFGFSWVFHILSEERVIVSDFLYEYLFLMTTCTHIIALSLFFVIFQENTRREWITVLKMFFTKINRRIRRTTRP